MVSKFINDFFRVSISLIAIESPTPRIGPISGEISIAPITTALESAFKPTEATKIEQIRIHAVAPLKGISAFIAEIVASRSVSSLKSSSSIKKTLIDATKPLASALTAALESIDSLLSCF